MMIASVRSYADFKLVANTLRHLDAVFYNNSVVIAGSGYGVAYAFDYIDGMAVVGEVAGGITLSTTDFPGAIAIGDRMFVSDQSALSTAF
jgi:hypothetical protein